VYFSSETFGPHIFGLKFLIMSHFCLPVFSRVTVPLLFVLFLSFRVNAQSAADSVLESATLENVIAYSLKHQPLIQQSAIDQETVNTTINTKLADWFPQINFNYNLQHNYSLQPTYVAALGGVARFGIQNTSQGQFAVTQNIFNRDVLLAASSAGEVRTQAYQKTISNKIDLTVGVTKAFYDVLATNQQIKVGQGDVVRLKQSLKTAYDQYVSGIVDKTDYKRATITLSNTQATLKSNQELLKYKVEYLKSLMGYPVSQTLDIVYDTLQMENEIFLDTLQIVDYSDRVDYKLLETQKRLQEYNVMYSQWSFLPSLSITGAYNFYFLSQRVSDLYRVNTPFSNAIILMTLPIFQGGKRLATIKQQRLTLKRADWDLINLRNNIHSQYQQVLAAYKSNLVLYNTLKQNVELAKEVYDIIQLQYKTGVKSYLEVITAETDFRTARINYFNALYQVLASKIDVQKALGQIVYN
jgi:outer membrane protein